MPSKNRKPNSDDFGKFMLSEYRNLSKAHYTTIEAISSFFRYYLTIMAIPFALIGIFAGTKGLTETLELLSTFSLPLTILLFVISVAGFLVLLYMVSLRMDVILYARGVNAIRKYFYDKSGMGVDAQLRTRVLPQTAYQPKYYEVRYFMPVVLCFAVLDALYLLASWVFLFMYLAQTAWLIIPLWIAIAIALFLFSLSSGAHIFFYRKYTTYWEHKYLRTYGMGVDVDGVLNPHEFHFCKLLRAKTGKIVNPEKMRKIPIHEDPPMHVSREEAENVFNSPEYWTDMPAYPEAARRINDLRNAFKLKVHLFTHREWPTTDTNPDAARARLDAWEVAAARFLDSASLARTVEDLQLGLSQRIQKWIDHVRLGMRGGALEARPIDVITRWWLFEKGFRYDSLTIEHGSDHISDPQSPFHNRFYISRQEGFRFFVEDDPEKAAKLAYICDVVFLLDHHYNRRARASLPSNVIRVETWNDIYQRVRELS